MSAWPHRKLGDVCEIIAGQSPPGSSYNADQIGLPFYQGKKEFGTREIGSPTTWTSETTKIAKAGDILMSVRAPVGPVNFLCETACIGRGLAAIRAGEKVDRDFLFYNLLMREPEISGTEGAVFASINRTEIAALEIALPSLEEQRRIVAVLNEAFAAIATAIANVEENLANAQECFSAQREFLLAGQADWTNARLTDLCSIKHGFTFKSQYFTEAGDYVLLTPGNFFEAGGYRDRGPKQKYYDGPIPKGFILEPGALLVAMTEQAAGLLGSPVIVPSDGAFLHNQRLGLVKPKVGVAWDNGFFFHVFNTVSARDELHKTGTGVKVRHTSPEKIGRLKVAVPPSLTEQRAVANQLDRLADQIEMFTTIQQKKLGKLAELKQSLLHRAFSGELTEREPLAA